MLPRENIPSQAKPNSPIFGWSPWFTTGAPHSSHVDVLSCHQALHRHQPWKSLITQDDNIKTIKPTYISKTASLLSRLQVIKICHSTHKPLKHWTWWVVLRRPLLRPKPFFTQGLCPRSPKMLHSNADGDSSRVLPRHGPLLRSQNWHSGLVWHASKHAHSYTYTET